MQSNEEIVLSFQQGKESPLETLYLQNINLIRKTCLPYCRGSEDDLEDLTQEAYFILISAAETFNPTAGRSFAGWLYKNLKWKLPRIVNRMREFRIPEYRINRVADLERAEAEGLNKEQILIRYGWKPEVYEMARSDRQMLHGTSLDKATMDDLTVADMVGADDPNLEAVENQELNSQLWAEVDILKDTERKVIRAKYKDGKQITEFCEQSGISYAKLAASHKEALKKLRKNKKIQIIAEAKYFKGSGLGAFKRTGSSSTERIAIWLYERKK